MDANDFAKRRYALGRGIRRLSRLQFQLTNTRLETIGLGSGQVPILMELHHHGSMSQRQLAQRIQVTPATVSGALKRMEKADLVCRIPDPNDARVTRVELTGQGRELLHKSRRIFDEVASEMIEGLDDQVVEVLESAVKTMQSNLHARVAKPSIPKPEKEENE